jgi:hypothetical protein
VWSFSQKAQEPPLTRFTRGFGRCLSGVLDVGCGCGASLSSRWSAGFPRRPWSRSRVCTPTNHPATICMYLFVYPKSFLSHSFRGFILREDRQECCESTSVNPFVSSDKARGADRDKNPRSQLPTKHEPALTSTSPRHLRAVTLPTYQSPPPPPVVLHRS